MPIDKEESLPTRRPVKKRVRSICKGMLPLLVLAAGLAVASYVYSTAPEAKRKRPQEKAPLVLIEEVVKADQQVIVRAMGTVVPARKIALKAQVSGIITTVSPEFATGSVLKAGAEIASIDPKDYELALIQKKSQVADARYVLKMEMGNQDVAKREWELINGATPARDGDAELALRKPHLEKAEADLAAAQAQLDQARLDLERTRLKVPFNCIVMAKHIDLGSFVSTQAEIATLAGTDEYWVQAAVPVDRLKWIALPRGQERTGSFARIVYGADGTSSVVREGRVVRLLADLEEEGRMARILISVKDPLDLKHSGKARPPLLLGEYVKVEIEGPTLSGVVAVPRSALRDGEKIWIVGKDATLDVRTVDVVWRDRDTVLITNGIGDGDRLIVSDLAAPVTGMKVMVENHSDGPEAPDRASKAVERR